MSKIQNVDISYEEGTPELPKIKIKEVIRYRTEDGNLFKSKSEAEKHTGAIEFKRAINSVIGQFYYGSMDKDYLIEKIICYAPELIEVFNKYTAGGQVDKAGGK